MQETKTPKYNDVILTVQQASLFLQMSKSWLDQSRLKGGGDMPPFLKFGRSVRYSRQALETWLESRGRKSTSDKGL